MSWSVGATGKAAIVAEAIKKQFSGMTHLCPEPEESAKQLVRKTIDTLLAGHTKPGTIVKVGASGSQGYSGSSGSVEGLKEVYNSLNVSVETISIVE